MFPWCVSSSPYGAIGTITPYGYLTKELQSNSKSVSMSVSMSLFVYLFVSFSVSLYVSESVLNMALLIFMGVVAIMFLIPKDPTMWHRKLKGLPNER